MLLKQLSDDDKRSFLCLAELLSLADQPMLWDGEARSPMSRNTKFTRVAIQRRGARTAIVKELASALEDRDGLSIFEKFRTSELAPTDIEAALVKPVAALPLKSESDPSVRLKVAVEVLREILKNKKAKTPSVPKLMLFELMLLALADGSISAIQWQLLTEFRHHYGIEEFLFRDLLTRAEATHVETQKTLAIILE